MTETQQLRQLASRAKAAPRLTALEFVAGGFSTGFVLFALALVLIDAIF